jgi:hypothetical protein
MRRSARVIAMTGKSQVDTPNGLSFGASFESSKSKRRVTAHIIVMKGGIMLVDEALNIRPGRPVSGPIYCDNGR